MKLSVAYDARSLSASRYTSIRQRQVLMWNDLPAVLGTLVTGAFALGGVWVANRGNAKQVERQLEHQALREDVLAQRERLEELYAMLSRWSGRVVVRFTTHRLAMDGSLSYNDVLDITNNWPEDIDGSRLFTLAELYFPATHANLDAVKSARDKVIEIEASFKAQYRRDGQPSPDHSQRITAALQAFSESVDRYKAELVEVALNSPVLRLKGLDRGDHA